jgi:hypothetical protein
VVEGKTKHDKVTYVLSRNTKADGLEERGETFSIIKDIY